MSHTRQLRLKRANRTHMTSADFAELGEEVNAAIEAVGDTNGHKGRELMKSAAIRHYSLAISADPYHRDLPSGEAELKEKFSAQGKANFREAIGGVMRARGVDEEDFAPLADKYTDAVFSAVELFLKAREKSRNAARATA